MVSRSSWIILFALFLGSITQAQDFPRWNFNIGGGVGFPLSTTSDFVGNGGNFVVGGGPNFTRYLGVNSEFMWQDLPIKGSVINAFSPDANAREYSVTLNGILQNPGTSRIGAYIIGGGGWYHRSGKATAQVLVPGTVCPAFWNWWGTCVNGLWPADVVIASGSSNSFGGNIGAGVSVRIAESPVKFYTEVRYHHASHNTIDTDLLPLTFGFRW